jgi:hypothetical protein
MIHIGWNCPKMQPAMLRMEIARYAFPRVVEFSD